MSTQKPINIDTLLLKLKGEALTAEHSISDVEKVNSICDAFIMKLKGAAVNIKDYDISVTLDDTTVSKKKIVEKVASEPDPEPEICTICKDALDDMTDTLKCGHKFHHECALFWYKEQNTGSAYDGNNIPRCCPYCRSDGGYLILHPGETHIANIHAPEPVKVAPAEVAPFKIVPASVKVAKSAKTKLSKNNWQCLALTKKGKQCKNTRTDGTNYCHLASHCAS